LSNLPATIAEFKIVQNQLRSAVILEDRLDGVCHIAGIDVGFEDNYRFTRAAVVILSFPELAIVETAIARVPTVFPYVPGFLSFREIPAILPALDQLKTQPDLIFCDGQGYAHPRRLGIASHLGVLIDRPTIGVAKSRLVGTHSEVPSEIGKWVELMDEEEQIGVVLRSRSKVKPLYISSGHRISLPTAIDYVLACITKYRLPEPTRLADKLASRKPMPQSPPHS
jgi:deoxyribonuclease V